MFATGRSLSVLKDVHSTGEITQHNRAQTNLFDGGDKSGARPSTLRNRGFPGARASAAIEVGPITVVRDEGPGYARALLDDVASQAYCASAWMR